MVGRYIGWQIVRSFMDKKDASLEKLMTLSEEEIFYKSNIEIDYHEYNHPKYKQKGKKFISHLSILDLLFNEKENSNKII
mgnify:CR=1 FL=1